MVIKQIYYFFTIVHRGYNLATMLIDEDAKSNRFTGEAKLVPPN